MLSGIRITCIIGGLCFLQIIIFFFVKRTTAWSKRKKKSCSYTSIVCFSQDRASGSSATHWRPESTGPTSHPLSNEAEKICLLIYLHVPYVLCLNIVTKKVKLFLLTIDALKSAKNKTKQNKRHPISLSLC